MYLDELQRQYIYNNIVANQLYNINNNACLNELIDIKSITISSWLKLP